jgi:hypothetical protein
LAGGWFGDDSGRLGFRGRSDRERQRKPNQPGGGVEHVGASRNPSSPVPELVDGWPERQHIEGAMRGVACVPLCVETETRVREIKRNERDVSWAVLDSYICVYVWTGYIRVC